MKKSKILSWLTLGSLGASALSSCNSFYMDDVSPTYGFNHMTSMSAYYEGYVVSISGVGFSYYNNDFAYNCDDNLSVSLFESEDDYSKEKPLKELDFKVVSKRAGGSYFPPNVLAECEDGSQLFLPGITDYYYDRYMFSYTEVAPFAMFKHFLGTEDTVLFGSKETDNEVFYVKDAESELASFYNHDGTLLHTQYVNKNKNQSDYAGPMPYKDATLNKLYKFSGWEKTGTAKYTAKFEEQNASSYLSYDLSADKTYYTVSVKSGFSASAVKIASSVGEGSDEKPVKGIANDAFKGIQSLVKVELLEGTQTIGENAFNGCTNLRFINTGYLATLGKAAFAKTAIESVNFNHVGKLPDSLFAGCKRLKHVGSNFPNLEIGGNCFDGCTSLEWLDFSSNVSSWGSNSLANIKNLKWIFMKDNASVAGSALKNSSFDIYVKGSSLNTSFGWNNEYKGTVRYYLEDSTSAPSDPSRYWKYDKNGLPVNLG